MNDKTDDQMKEEIRETIEEGNKTEVTEEQTIEEQAAAMGWHKDGKNIHGETVSAERYIQEKPLYETIGKLKSTLSRIDTKVIDLQNDNRKIAAAGIKEKENLLEQLKEAKDQALNNFEADEVRRIDKKMDDVREDIAKTPTETESPNYPAFLEDNEWANDDSDVRTIASFKIAHDYQLLNPDKGDKAMYDHVHKRIREIFPEKFETKKPTQKVSSTNKRVTTDSQKKTKVTLADLEYEEARLVRNMMKITGKTEEEYMKNYSTEALR